jgi:predicted nuclease of predicted toxin-antitoxin system
VNFRIDENLPIEIASDLTALGHDTDTLATDGLAGAHDLKVISAAVAVNRILLTLDKGITDELRSPSLHHSGVVLFRPKTTGIGAVLDFVRANLPAVLELPIAGRVTVVNEDGIRVR